jgi:succinate dehydrogenase / fumarate reductase iron-sulfur subunit
MRYVLSTCMTCGCCLEVCPQVSPATDFIGAAAISQVRLFNSHPTGKMNASDRLHGLMGPGGVNDSISEMARETTKQSFVDFFRRDERKSGGGPA